MTEIEDKRKKKYRTYERYKKGDYSALNYNRTSNLFWTCGYCERRVRNRYNKCPRCGKEKRQNEEKYI